MLHHPACHPPDTCNNFRRSSRPWGTSDWASCRRCVSGGRLSSTCASVLTPILLPLSRQTLPRPVSSERRTTPRSFTPSGFSHKSPSQQGVLSSLKNCVVLVCRSRRGSLGGSRPVCARTRWPHRPRRDGANGRRGEPHRRYWCKPALTVRADAGGGSTCCWAVCERHS